MTVQDAIAAWTQLLGADAVSTETFDYLANVTGYTRDVPAVLRVRSGDQVAGVVAIAREYRVPVHPISTGRNWGLGSRLPVRAGTVVVDLGGLDRVLAVNRGTGTVVIEPGVTQGALAEHLDRECPDLIANMTGSAADTSIVGNALDHGIGYLATRSSDIIGLEVVLGTGETLRTGEWPTEGSHHGSHWHHGIGPKMDGLFLQSNFGIVTGMAVRLRSRATETRAFRASLKEDDRFTELIDQLAVLRRDEVLSTPVRIFDQTWMTGGASGAAWSAFGGLHGRRSVVASLQGEVSQSLANTALLEFSSGTTDPSDSSWWRSVVSVMDGRPTNLSVTNWVERVGATFETTEDLDRSDFGMLCDVRAIPFAGAAAYRAVTLARAVCADFGWRPCVSLSALDGYSLEAVFILLFNRSTEIQVAHRVFDALTTALTEAGLVPHRVGVGKMTDHISADSQFWATAARIKRVLDPDLVISPGRYNLL